MPWAAGLNRFARHAAGGSGVDCSGVIRAGKRPDRQGGRRSGLSSPSAGPGLTRSLRHAGDCSQSAEKPS